MSRYKKTLLIDLDGVLNNYDGNFVESVIPTIRFGVYEFLENLCNDYDLKIFTTRNRLLVAKWLICNNIDKFISDITNVKEPAYLYIDDRCICFDGDFDKLLSAINNFKAWWK